jgi:hypothetical protein
MSCTWTQPLELAEQPYLQWKEHADQFFCKEHPDHFFSEEPIPADHNRSQKIQSLKTGRTYVFFLGYVEGLVTRQPQLLCIQKQHIQLLCAAASDGYCGHMGTGTAESLKLTMFEVKQKRHGLTYTTYACKDTKII